jgi:isopenicillin N synthase-like dioxygenase
MSQLPVLDLSRFDAGPAEHAAFLADLGTAAREAGFFYLIGHGIEQPKADRVTALAHRFFALPEADKLAVEMVNSPHFRGYNRAASELTRGRPDWREQIDIGAERSPLAIGPDSPPWARLQGPNQWPRALPELKPVVQDWIAEVTAVGLKLLQAFALALGQTADVFAPIYTPTPNVLLKLIRYPGRDTTDSDQGVGAHKDGGFLTLLYQADQPGLQVETEGGDWIDAPPVPGSFVVNIGELLELASDGYLKANVHRAVTPPSGSERLSIAFFLGGNLDASIPLLDLPPDLAAKRRGVTRDSSNPLIREVGLNALKGRLRSHPDVAQRHHADLVASLKLAGQPASAYAEP